MIKITSQFNAIGSDGKRYAVTELTEFRDTTKLGSTTKNLIPVIKSYQLDPQRTPVNYEAGKYVIAGTTIVLTPVE